jgi:glycosyltransferase involved in cell wall biosynthesis
MFYDVPDWAFYNVAQNIRRVAEPPYVVDIFGHDDWFGVSGRSDEIIAECDIAVFLWRFDLLVFLDSLGDAGWRALLHNQRCAFVVLVYDHVYNAPTDMASVGNPFEVADCVAASSRRLCGLYSAADHLPNITHCVPDGVDLQLFAPAPPEITAPPASDTLRPLRIGWVGNSAWGITLGHDFKGKHGVFDPALEILRGLDLPFTVHVADKAEHRVPHADMPDFYREIDVLVCASLFEGTPNPVLEAMASGCAVVSTDVGIVPDIFGPEQMQFILPKRSAPALAACLERLIREPETLLALKRENTARRDTLGWQTHWPAWQALFREARENVIARPETNRALASFRVRRRSPFVRVRRFIATNRLAFRAYSLILAKLPGLIRVGKRVLSGGGR